MHDVMLQEDIFEQNLHCFHEMTGLRYSFSNLPYVLLFIANPFYKKSVTMMLFMSHKTVIITFHWVGRS